VSGAPAQDLGEAGPIFTAVLTTGIYCRPGCGAKPLVTNKVGYPLAAAAEADGFRACFRCRPYRMAPPLPQGSDLICRTVAMILNGELDDGTEHGLAHRLGVSTRHLRRRCLAELGVTPNDLARSVRAHFARRLLDDTDLPISDLAFAAGFTSIRQFHREMQRVFHGTPQDLRRRRRAGDRLVTDGGLATRLPYDGELRWHDLLDRASPIPGVESVREGVYRRTIAVRGAVGVLEMSHPESGTVQLVLHLPHWEELAHLVPRARRLIGLDDPEATLPRAIRSWTNHEHVTKTRLNHEDPTGHRLKQYVAGYGLHMPGLPAGLTHLFPIPGTTDNG
jgi:AraC family transcriptional regulator, regulatory protein of adaptative response / DNA-3-methyladenine glycosylase II